jgi:hypothetical protein
MTHGPSQARAAALVPTRAEPASVRLRAEHKREGGVSRQEYLSRLKADLAEYFGSARAAGVHAPALACSCLLPAAMCCLQLPVAAGGNVRRYVFAA